MSVHENLIEISKSLENLEETGIYDVEKYSCSLKHLTNQLEYFYCHLVKEKGTSANPEFEMDIEVMMSGVKTKSRLQLSEIRCVDMQRLDLRKTFCDVLSSHDDIIKYVKEHLLK